MFNKPPRPPATDPHQFSHCTLKATSIANPTVGGCFNIGTPSGTSIFVYKERSAPRALKCFYCNNTKRHASTYASVTSHHSM
ncbi:uncharacterized protein BO87DRAFT_374162 [Aspergillus neoniger CBS 115656]|uniref:Uncharacterized protein n=1 Tax=Aspergillus neoniger (strain CBS 115656) TaxID=1448310 RepID=A0A318YRY4_ASPNB|nr:hypothetical protein BO87DRAFT_374162 [Aspergillus neoniger CBS 115656]PYH37136.1 hypothetical protein BO87DRAFT_374162 [Aspergillus neoniger CBS 115656]